MKQYVWTRAATVCAAAALTVAGTTGAAIAAEAPSAPVVTSQEYPDDDNWHDGVGSYGTFLIDSASDDVVSYRYSWLGGSTRTLTASEPGAPVSLRWMPETEGVTYLQAQAVNAEGAISAGTTYYVRVQDGRAAVTHWDPDDQSGAVTGSGVTLGASGPSGTGVASAAAFDGTDEAYAALDLSVDSAQNFSVDAWVRPDALSADSTAVTQAGFALGTSTGPADAPVWSFTLPTADGGTARLTGGAPEQGEWAHLVGVYDAEQDTARLYVDGELTGTAESVTAAGGTGTLRIGADGNSGHWQGLLTDVNVWDRVFVPEEITATATRKAQRLGYWDLEAAPDGKSPAYAGGEPLTLAGDASLHAATDDCAWNPDCTPVQYPLVGNADLLLDGDGDYATTPTALTPTDAGFSVAAHVRLDEAAATRDMTVLSQPGEHTDLLTLRYVAASQTWQAVVAHEDRADAPTTTVSAPLGSSPSAGEQFLAVVYDEKTDELRLYVDYNYAADTASVTGADTWTPTGDLQIGRTLTADGDTDHLAGEVDEIHSYAGVVSSTQLSSLRLGGTDS
ncbi:LamG domain-containing protein [Streptomyces fulvoviolaceus]|uniref:LamG domain-containing protein n=1 Tax=Streptomyces fulvoviolaceus TaxID=285535 RepID=UPI000AE551B2|nr:LamG domain-containing protein [Streptomyces fulvoviolaceus]